MSAWAISCSGGNGYMAEYPGVEQLTRDAKSLMLRQRQRSVTIAREPAGRAGFASVTGCENPCRKVAATLRSRIGHQLTQIAWAAGLPSRRWRRPARGSTCRIMPAGARASARSRGGQS